MLIAITWLNRQKPTAPAAEVTLQSMSKEEAPKVTGAPQPTPTTQEPSKPVKPWPPPANPVDLHALIREQRRLGGVMPASDKSRKWSEIFGLKAIPTNRFHDSLGKKTSERSGYVVYETSDQTSALTEFGGNELAVVQRRGGGGQGIVSGELAVTFHTYPDDVEGFASEHALKVVSELKNLNTVIFTPKIFPANLLELVAQISEMKVVKQAEIAIIYGNRRVN